MRYALVPNRLVRAGRSPRRTAAALLACGALLFGATEAVIGAAHPAATQTVATVAAGSTQASSATSSSSSASSSPSSASDTSVSAAPATPTSATS